MDIFYTEGVKIVRFSQDHGTDKPASDEEAVRTGICDQWYAGIIDRKDKAMNKELRSL